MPHDALQTRIARWVVEAFGNKIFHDRQERARRVLEEAIELAQSENIELAQAERLLKHVYSRPAGRPEQEAAGVGTTLFSWAAATDNDLLDLVETEYRRITDPETMKKIRLKNLEKRRTGIGVALFREASPDETGDHLDDPDYGL